jgi:hypothetical protein
MLIWLQLGWIFVAFVGVATPCAATEIVRADGSRYVGQVVDGKADGQGVDTKPDGTVFKGRFSKDSFVEGTMRQGGWVVPFSNCHSPDGTTRARD